MSSVSPRRSYCGWASPVTLGLGLCLGLRLGFCLGLQLGFCLSFRPGFISFAVWELNEVKVNPVNKGRVLEAGAGGAFLAGVCSLVSSCASCLLAWGRNASLAWGPKIPQPLIFTLYHKAQFQAKRRRPRSSYLTPYFLDRQSY